MYSLMYNEVKKQLTSLQKDHKQQYDEFKKAWHDTRVWKCTKQSKNNFDRILIPYIGSGINKLTNYGIDSWGELIKKISAISSPLGSEYQVRRSGLTLPQQLELLLRNVSESQMGSIIEMFKEIFNQKVDVSELHKRLLRMFPTIVTTNYDQIIENAASNWKSYDLTDPNIELNQNFPFLKNIILHLHGLWDSENTKNIKKQIFWGVGGYNQKHDTPCLVLTEYQYHRLYNNSESFKKIVSKLFDPKKTLILFLGASLNNDESGIHAIFTERKIKGSQNLAGIYVGIDLDPLKRDLFRIRGIESINLKQRFGYSKVVIETFFHAFFDACEDKFYAQSTNKYISNIECPSIEILCSGISSWNQVISIGEKSELRNETSYPISDDNFIEEAGGQHLYPALHLALRGHKVAIATVLGDDEYGDKIEKSMREVVNKIELKPGGGDLAAYIIEKKDATRISFVVTYGGTRVIFDYDGKYKCPKNLSYKDILTEYDLKILRKLKAIYIGTYFPDFQKYLLENLEEIPFKFFESGTRGPDEQNRFNKVVEIARKCNYVLSSSEFLLRLSKKISPDLIFNTEDCQKQVADDRDNGRTFLESGFNTLWEKSDKPGVLIVLIGSYGSAIVEFKNGKIVVTPVNSGIVPKNMGLNWLGCGDLFRGEFIHQILSKKPENIIDAAKAASIVVMERIKRMPLLENNDI